MRHNGPVAWKEFRMLVLSRKEKERIVINDNIELVIVSVKGNRVKLGFNAPSDVPICREELHRRIISQVYPTEMRECGGQP
jgi:carbon storage regulator